MFKIPKLFDNRYKEYLIKKQILNSVQRLFGFSPKPFLELDQIKEELHICSQLFNLFTRFNEFDKMFRNTLWKSLDLKNSKHVVSLIHKLDTCVIILKC